MWTSFAARYTPTTQKELFNSEACTAVRQWVRALQDPSRTCFKDTLLVWGPTGCGKSASLDILLKPFTVAHINSDDLRTADTTKTVLRSLSSHKTLSLENIEKWNHATRRDRPRVFVIDNIELCDKTIKTAVEELANDNLNAPVVLICNTKRVADGLLSSVNTVVAFKKPTLLETMKLALAVNKRDQLGLTQAQLQTIAEFIQGDIRQLLYVLEQWSVQRRTQRTPSLCAFLESFGKKEHDTDLLEKMVRLTDPDTPIDIEDSSLISHSDPIVVSFAMFQNHIPFMDAFGRDDVDTMEAVANAADSISIANVYNNAVYNSQHWDMYAYFVFHSCVVPSAILKSGLSPVTPADVERVYAPYRDISYNYHNSLADVRAQLSSSKYNDEQEIFHVYAYQSDMSIAIIVNIIKLKLNALKDVIKSLGKSWKSMDSEAGRALVTDLSALIYKYNLFEIDYTTANDRPTDLAAFQKEYANKLDFKRLKKLVNVFDMQHEKDKLFAKCEGFLKQKVLEIAFRRYHDVQCKQLVKSDAQLEDSIVDLASVWAI